ncbi:3-hydroxyacyl-CoA dehydrogenase / enoyl-CoA hydratase / 3-hydroxybutyryl-CoA epimerase [Cribrihabitans marinus]|uniref:enoyl-CoA hydratase n=1 Tax=Cribrihabitans marinus TaxID=1227549 RepID=A0A1H7D2C4_9RHOB|nr:3-hydroxyacyl-CoA dehydrogenase NAD-binding domain-containing protein [Cribrihabitans marinus]GGH37631.1 fatty-acid oxidation protein subunit alpha [Cribrihabitans marinus]SEJ96063.1 3-hydroxyacyl-CoA dehydrogenase / enoyl-CoA hydratase / 3-hydroxybutyryl-CoA epimerase [Cribrihabitans marinus]
MTGPVLKHLGETKLELGPATEPRHPWRRAEADGVVWLVLDCEGSSANTISRAVIEGLSDELDRLEETPPKGVVIRSAKPSGFALGADIGSFDDMAADGAAALLRQGHAVLDRLAALPCPTIAVVHGPALGAGFEIALACDRRIAIDGASFGLPEVQLGLHPGLGGTFRLPALIDPLEAMTMMLTGKSAHTRKARKLGIADEVVQERHMAAAVQAMLDAESDRSPGLKARALRFDQARALAARQMRSETRKKAPEDHYPAPHRLIDLWEEHGDDAQAMQQAEIDSFAELLGTETSKNLRRAFFLRQHLKEGARGEDGIAHVHVIGAGAMGAEIAAWAAVKGKRVTLGDVETAPLGRAIADARSVAKAAHLSDIEIRDALDRLVPDPNGYGLARADLVIEAGPETVETKRAIYDNIGPRMKSGAILATNTSSLSLDDLRDGAPEAARFAGLHFFNPVSKMQLVEVVRHAGTDDETARRLAAFCGSIDRLPVQLRDYPGFLVNRALTPYLLEAMVLMDEGVDKEVIDTAAIRFGMPMGPVALADQVGLDIGLHVGESLKAGLDKPLPDISDTLRGKVKNGELGKKTGAGFYDWSDGTPAPDADLDDAPEDLTDRLILPMLDACVECLRRDIAADPDSVDAAMIFATGFAPFRGGPLHYAKQRGAEEIAGRMRALASRHGARFEPDPGWADL